MTQVRHAGWKEDESALLFAVAEQAEREGRPLRDVFGDVAARLGRKPNSIRNYYYARMRELPESHARKAPFRTFTDDELHALLREVLLAKARGESVRACVTRMASGDRSRMLRYQNKYRSVLKARPALIRSVADELRAEGCDVPTVEPRAAVDRADALLRRAAELERRTGEQLLVPMLETFCALLQRVADADARGDGRCDTRGNVLADSCSNVLADVHGDMLADTHSDASADGSRLSADASVGDAADTLALFAATNGAPSLAAASSRAPKSARACHRHKRQSGSGDPSDAGSDAADGGDSEADDNAPETDDSDDRTDAVGESVVNADHARTVAPALLSPEGAAELCAERDQALRYAQAAEQRRDDALRSADRLRVQVDLLKLRLEDAQTSDSP